MADNVEDPSLRIYSLIFVFNSNMRVTFVNVFTYKMGINSLAKLIIFSKTSEYVLYLGHRIFVGQ